MDELLDSLGIDRLDSFIYEYGPVTIDWWDAEYETTIEIEVHQNEEGFCGISVFFCPEWEGIVERTLVYTACFKAGSLGQPALIAEKIYQALLGSETFTFSKPQNAYIIDLYEDAEKAFSAISKLIANKKPTYLVDLKAREEENEPAPLEPGNTLDHFIAMMEVNSMEFTEEKIIENIEISIALEGAEYLSLLKKDVIDEIPQPIKEEYDLDDEMIGLFKKTIQGYKIV
ncbi:MAG: hypothetical protein AAF206_32235 [Bacteroidota bacterium]